MAYATPSSFGTRFSLSALGHRFGAWLERIGEAHSRRAQIEQLNRLSDRQLADIGLKRDDIVAFVFRDRMGF